MGREQEVEEETGSGKEVEIGQPGKNRSLPAKDSFPPARFIRVPRQARKTIVGDGTRAQASLTKLRCPESSDSFRMMAIDHEQTRDERNGGTDLSIDGKNKGAFAEASNRK